MRVSVRVLVQVVIPTESEVAMVSVHDLADVDGEHGAKVLTRRIGNAIAEVLKQEGCLGVETPEQSADHQP